MHEQLIHYTDVDGRFGRVFITLLFGWFAACGWWFLYLLVAYPPSVLAGIVLGGAVLVVFTWSASWLALRLAVGSWRSGRGTWWVRLSDNGFEVNDGILHPRRHKWHEVDAFMVVAPAGQLNSGAPSVGYRLVNSRPSLARRLFANFRDRDGKLANGVIMGFWDRPVDDAVDLLNEWRSRHCPAKEMDAL
jgi:hypothetical protein